jgi:hypothetical protein
MAERRRLPRAQEPMVASWTCINVNDLSALLTGR